MDFGSWEEKLLWGRGLVRSRMLSRLSVREGGERPGDALIWPEGSVRGLGRGVTVSVVYLVLKRLNSVSRLVVLNSYCRLSVCRIM